ncbi:MAG: hypothetical protein ABEH38_07425 [Flavobacteriales bacterium]
MKRKHLSRFFFFTITALLLQSCWKIPVHVMEKKPKKEMKNVVIKTEEYLIDWKFTLWCCIGVPRWKKQINGMKIKAVNNGEKPVKIIWNESSITYAGKTKRPCFKGRGYAGCGQQNVPPLTIPPNGQSTKKVFPAGSIVKNEEGAWQMNGLQGIKKGDQIKFSIKVGYEDDTEKYYTFTDKAPLPGHPVWGWNLKSESCEGAACESGG